MLGPIVCYVMCGGVVMYHVQCYADTQHKMNLICRHLDGHSIQVYFGICCILNYYYYFEE